MPHRLGLGCGGSSPAAEAVTQQPSKTPRKTSARQKMMLGFMVETNATEIKPAPPANQYRPVSICREASRIPALILRRDVR